MPQLDDLERKWVLKCQTGAIRRRLEITSEGLMHGAGVCLTKMIRDAGGASVLALDGQGSRIIALLSVAYERAVPVSIMAAEGLGPLEPGRESARPCPLELLPPSALRDERAGLSTLRRQ